MTVSGRTISSGQALRLRRPRCAARTNRYSSGARSPGYCSDQYINGRGANLKADLRGFSPDMLNSVRTREVVLRDGRVVGRPSLELTPACMAREFQARVPCAVGLGGSDRGTPSKHSSPWPGYPSVARWRSTSTRLSRHRHFRGGWNLIATAPVGGNCIQAFTYLRIGVRGQSVDLRPDGGQHPPGIVTAPPRAAGMGHHDGLITIVLEVRAMEKGRVADVIVVESEKVGQPTRTGEILEVRGEGDLVHYLVRWDNGHESTYFASGAAVTFKHRQPAG